MCKVGDIIIVADAINPGTGYIGVHPFVVLDDTEGCISGIYQYDFAGVVLSSMDTEEKHSKMLSEETQFPIAPDDKIIDDDTKDNLPGRIRMDMIFYFDKEKIKYKPFGRVDDDIMELLFEFIDELAQKGYKFKRVVRQTKKI